MRHVELELDADQINTACETVGHEKFWQAVGYLSTWSPSRPRVVIYIQDKTDLVAVYKDADSNTTYVIGAVWHEDHYGFHS